MTRTIKLSDGKLIPAVGWGNGTGGLFGNQEDSITSGIEALKAGSRHIDSAQAYQTEEAAASAIKQSGLKREDIWVTTKISKTDLVPTADVIRPIVLERIEKLGSKPNLLLIHFPTVPAPGKIGAFWTVLEDLVYDGTLEGVSLGVSNFRPQDLEDVIKVARIKPVVNQLEYHPYVLSHLQPVLELGEKHGIVTESYGLLTPLLRHPTGGPIKPILERVAARLSKETGKDIDVATALLLWCLQKNVVAVTSSKNPVNLRKQVEAESLPPLMDEEVKEIDEAGKKVHFRHYTMHMTKDFSNPDLPEDL
ncbi:uncharacterized protein IL334_000874 [Kwoniella shivajii]|uniref:NADP-dependent oxidoreductase domain-containing protein n=1 Tax=Kwoniella shivajii TaxID=564305 RepID=A0ABZ1CRF9_9TREE|nr:hypothetical protein IL334_000874 [Kwoniella shivajii]